jgi:rfaE bifunctional protein nucleotidyltransferase chain/domain
MSVMSPETRKSNVVSLPSLVRARRRWQRQGLRVVFTNGVFDVLHRGHLDVLAQAKACGDVLVVGLNSDGSARRLKGPGRPVNSQKDRAVLLAALRPVDCVCLFGEPTPLRLIRALYPDVLVKGAEYAHEEIVGADLVAGWGGEVIRVRMRPNYSSTNLIRKCASTARRARR